MHDMKGRNGELRVGTHVGNPIAFETAEMISEEFLTGSPSISIKGT
jgi:hypothetical protein